MREAYTDIANQIMDAFWISLIASALVAVAYALLLGQREEKLRNYLKAKARGSLRRLYVNAMVEAVRGEAAVANSRSLASLILVVLLAGSLGLWYHALTFELRVTRTDLRLANLAQRLSDTAVTEPLDVVKQRRALMKQLSDTAAFHDTTRGLVLFVVNWERSLSTVLYVLFYAGWIFWLPYSLMRTRFDHEIARFSLRIQGLASRDELVRLTEAELAVRDPETLKQYVEIMKESPPGIECPS